jgi:hypothetical protein
MSHLQSFAEQQISSASNDLGHEKNSGEKVGLGESFLTRLLKMNSENPAKMSKADVFTTCITNIGAGSDTTSVSLTSVMYHLMRNPSEYEKVSTREYYPFHKCLLPKMVLRKKTALRRNPRSRQEGNPLLPLHLISGVTEIAILAGMYQRGSPYAPGYGPAVGPSCPRRWYYTLRKVFPSWGK